MASSPTIPCDREELWAALVLDFAEGIPELDKVRLVRQWGTCRGALAHLPIPTLPATLKLAEAELEHCRREGFSVVSYSSSLYPRLLREIIDAPVALFVWGELDPDDDLSIAIVGSRRATPYGVGVCEKLAGELASRGTTIVSGLARGIDSAAHRSALESGGRTIAVLGSGLNVIYPKEHRRLAERIASRGAVVTEFALATPPLPAHFPRRNRVISGMSLGTVVIEAAERSGSLITARSAADQNREVFAVPGPLGSPNSRGVHRLIQAGAKLVMETDDIIEELDPSARRRLSLCGASPAPAAHAAPRLPEDEQRLLLALQTQGPASADRLVALAKLPTDRVTAALVALEIHGLIEMLAGGLYRARSSTLWPGG